MGGRDPRPSRRAIHLLLVDALNLIRRVYAAQPGADDARRAEEARVASLQSLQRALREASPTHAVALFEGSGATWRHRAYPSYKAGHKPMPEALAEALPAYREAFATLGVRSFEFAATEADDVIATLAHKTAAAGGRVTILSTDKIFLQLVSPSIRVRDHFQKRDADRETVADRFGVEPEHLPDLLALAGESTSGVRGVPGIGLKTGARLLADFGSLDRLLEAARAPSEPADGDPVLAPRWAKKLADHTADARLARSLVRLDLSLDLGLSLQELRVQE